MKKKAYIIPGIKELDMESNLMETWSGGGNAQGDPQINPNPDNEEDDNRSRQRNIWADEEQDFV